MWGAELSRVKENYKEGRWRLYFNGSEGANFGIGHSQLWQIKLHKLTGLNLNLGLGFDADFFSVHSTDIDDPTAVGFITIPLGARYVHSIGDLKIGPEFYYNYGLSQPENWPGSTHIHIGSSIRWKLLQGGIFVNKGEEISYLGLRAGLAF